MNHKLRLDYRWLAPALLLLPGCADSSNNNDFLADNPFGGGSGRGEAGDSGGGEEPSDSDGGGEDGEREISEADIVKIVGNRLYALSQYGGLAIIDISKPNAFPVLGRYRAHAQPFEMYVEDDQVFVMFSDFGSYGFDAELGTYTWHSASRLVALDASDPANIELRGEFEMPGVIQDSRRVGDVLYLVTHEDGYCWNCADSANTTITSLDVSDLAAIEQVDQLTLPIQQDDMWGWSGQRSVSVTDERLYVAGIEYTDESDAHSVIEVVDISDPAGTLAKGASLEIAGMIESRWQMDEHEGVLRVISQPGVWNSGAPPVVETYSVASADDIAPLGSLTMTLPRPEALQSVRFDGTRAYAITFEQTDPLFIIDLSLPEEPKQMGELEIPGWVYHMEPRGDRLLGLGFDQTNAEGSINVSLFDVSDMAAPQLISRVHFGGSWANFAEDQNRIHKAFTVLDDLGLLLVPFSGWDYQEDDCYGTYHSGIQLVDWADDALSLRGVAPAESRSRRALLHEDRLLALSDQAVESFDISNRDEPVRIASTALATNVNSVGVGSGLVVRISQDWWTNQRELEVVSATDPESAEPLGKLSLAALADENDGDCWGGRYDAEIFVADGHAYLVRDSHNGYEWDGTAKTKIDVVDLSNPAAPEFVKTLELPFLRAQWSSWTGVATGERSTVLKNGKLVMSSRELDYEAETTMSQAAFEIIDLSEPGNPVHEATLPRPDGLAHGELLAFGDVVASWHMQQAAEDASKVRFYLERLDLSAPEAPALTEPVNVPGVVAAYDHESGRALTVDAKFSHTKESDESCWSSGSAYNYDYDNGICIRVERSLSLLAVGEQSATIVDTASVESDDLRIVAVVGSESRIFAQLQNGSGYWGWGVEDSAGGGAAVAGPHAAIAVFDGLGGNALEERSRLPLEMSDFWLGNLTAHADRLLFNADSGLGEVDASDAASPDLQVHGLYGYACWNVQVSGDTALCSMGEYGLQAISLQ